MTTPYTSQKTKQIIIIQIDASLMNKKPNNKKDRVPIISTNLVDLPKNNTLLIP